MVYEKLLKYVFDMCKTRAKSDDKPKVKYTNICGKDIIGCNIFPFKIDPADNPFNCISDNFFEPSSYFEFAFGSDPKSFEKLNDTKTLYNEGKTLYKIFEDTNKYRNKIYLNAKVCDLFEKDNVCEFYAGKDLYENIVQVVVDNSVVGYISPAKINNMKEVE